RNWSWRRRNYFLDGLSSKVIQSCHDYKPLYNVNNGRMDKENYAPEQGSLFNLSSAFQHSDFSEIIKWQLLL
ncbi:hypothetical protein OSK18_28740, partial [Escherichia coli]|nr:hypothetical protein [Escherichia coli]